MKVCIFTSAHIANDIRIFKKQLISLLNSGHEILYYTNRLDKNLNQAFVNTTEDIGRKNSKLTIMYNNDYNEEDRLKRFARSFLTFLKLDKSCNVYHFHDPDLIPTGLMLKMIGKKVIYDVHENYVETIKEKTYIPSKLRKVIAACFELLENFSVRRFDATLCATPKISERFIKKNISNVFTINNYPFANELRPLESKINKENILIYTGGITLKRGITQLVNALYIVNNTINCRLVMAGQIYPNEYEPELKNLPGWKFVDYKGVLSRTDMAIELATAKAGVVLFLPEKNHIDAQPNKLFEYMSAKLPVLCSSFPLWNDIILRNEIGLSADPLNIDEITNRIIDLLSLNQEELMQMGDRASLLIQSKYNWKQEEEKILAIYDGFKL